MAFSNLSKVLAKYFKGEQGESYVCDSIASLLRDKSDRENYYLIPKARLGFAENIFEIDLLLLHPTLGIFVVEVKNWDSLELIKKHSPYDQANKYRNLILSILKENFGDCPIPINVEMLSRIVSTKDQKRILAALKDGKVDVLFGTHKIYPMCWWNTL